MSKIHQYSFKDVVNIVIKIDRVDKSYWFDEITIKSKHQKIIDVLGNVKGKISEDDCELLRIVHNWNNEELSDAIKEYKEIYNKYIQEIKPYGKETWR